MYWIPACVKLRSRPTRLRHGARTSRLSSRNEKRWSQRQRCSRCSNGLDRRTTASIAAQHVSWCRPLGEELLPLTRSSFKINCLDSSRDPIHTYDSRRGWWEMQSARRVEDGGDEDGALSWAEMGASRPGERTLRALAGADPTRLH